MTDEDLAVLSQQVETMHRAAAAGERDEVAQADVRFHEYVIERSGQPHCLQIWRSIEPRVRAYFRRDARIRRRLEEIAEEHEALLEVLRRGDEGQMLNSLHTHINTFLTPGGRGGFT